jgi:hypothetical protein
LGPWLNAFPLFGLLKIQIRIAKAKNVEKHLLSFDLKILLPVYIFLKNIEKKKKIKNPLPLVVIPTHIAKCLFNVVVALIPKPPYQ